MKLSLFLIVFVLIYFVECKNNMKALTDSLGGEIIEIGTPIKELQELPPGVDEEPSAEMDEETTRPPPQTNTKRENKKVVLSLKTTTRALTTKKEVDNEDSVSQEDEEARIEKELAEIYKDTDYKSETTETVKELNVEKNTTDDKPIGRSRVNFKFQPDVNNRQDIERFRTSVDEISCDRRVTQRLSTKSKSKTTSEFVMSFMQMSLVVLALFVCH